jgi:RNA polymerase sigma factor (sigma-70 family)
LNRTANQQQLLQYVQTGSDEAFAEIVTRYLDLVYSVALRSVEGDTHLAEDVAQTVFADLARLAGSLPAKTMLGGWLHRHTCFLAANTMRAERRRRARERAAAELRALDSKAEPPMDAIGPILDDAVNQLAEPDRLAILLRFFEERDFRGVGEVLGSNEDAARMRVHRALEKLQELLKRRGISTSAAGLGLLLSANAVQSTPAGLASTISKAAVLAPLTTQSAAALAGKTLVMTTLQKSLVTGAIALLGGASLYQAARILNLERQVQVLQRQPAPWAGQIDQLRRQRDLASNSLAASLAENERLRRENTELPGLRGQVNQLRLVTNESAQLAGTAAEDKLWAAKVQALKQRLDQAPEKKIPELALLKDADWLQAAKEANLKTEAGARRAFNDLRTRARRAFADELQQAFPKYAEAHNDNLPPALADLKPYFDIPIGDDILQRYSYNRSGKWSDLRPNDGLVEATAPPVDLYDSHVTMLKKGMGVDNPVIPEDDNLLHVLDAYFAGNFADLDARWPKDPSQIEAYAKTPAELEAIRRLIATETGGPNQ